MAQLATEIVPGVEKGDLFSLVLLHSFGLFH